MAMKLTTAQKRKIKAALQLYRDRGEFDGTIGQARSCLVGAGYVWDRELSDYVKKLAKGSLAKGARYKARPSITSARVTTYPDSGQTKAWIGWSDGSSTSGSPDSAHMQALVSRAEREGIRVRYGLFGEER